MSFPHTSSRPARIAGLSFSIVRVALLGSLSAMVLAPFLTSCGDSTGVWSRYRLEKQFYRSNQAWSRATLQSEAGQGLPTEALEAQFEAVLQSFDQMRPELSRDDSALFVMAATTSYYLVQLYARDSLWNEVARHHSLVAGDTMFPTYFQYRAQMGLGQAQENLGQPEVAAATYRDLLRRYFPPESPGGVNTRVLQLPLRLLALADRHIPESALVIRTFAESYYDSLIRMYPRSRLANLAAGELGKLYAQYQEWPKVMTALDRAADSTGAPIPAYRIDAAEIYASQLGDTGKALEIYAEVIRDHRDGPFRMDAEIKRAALWLAQGQYERVVEHMKGLKAEFADRGSMVLAAQTLLAQALDGAGNWPRARAEYNYLITTFPRTLQAVEAALTLARHHEERNETTESAEWYNRADRLAADVAKDRNLNPAARTAAINVRASLALQLERWDDAVLRLAEVVESQSPQSPAGASALVRMGWVHLQERGDTAAAGQAWQTFMRAHPNHPECANLQDEMNKWPEHYREDLSS